MPISLKVESEFDERSAQNVVQAAHRFYNQAGSSAAREFSQGLSSGISAGLSGISSSAQSALSGINPSALAAAGGVAAIGTAAFAAGKQLYDLGVMWDNVVDGIAGRTGKLGDELTSITDSVKNVANTTASSIGDIGDIAGQVTQSLHLTGAPLETMTKSLADLNELTGENVNIRELGQAYRLFGVDVRDQVPALDAMFNASTSTGIPINELISIVGKAGPALKEFGLDFGESASLVATFEGAGLDAGGAVNGLRVALKNFAADGREPQQALRDTITEIKNLSDAGNAAAATDLAATTFGKGFAPFLDAIKSGKIDVDALNTALSNTGPSIDEVREKTSDWQEQLQTLKNELSTQLEPAASTTFSAISGLITVYLLNPIKQATDGIRGLKDALKDPSGSGNSGPATLDASGNVVAAPAGSPGSNPLAALSGTPGVGSGTTGNALDVILGRTPGAGPTGLSFTGGHLGDPRQLTDGGFFTLPTPPGGSSTGLPQAPAVPYDSTLPAGFAGLPQTSSLFGAESGYLDSRHELAERRARLVQLEGDANATENDIASARNDVITAERGQQQSEMRLHETRQDIYDKDLKQMQGHANDLGQLGAQLDSDFGVSKGLSGIAENLTKFIANIAAAPILGQLGAVSAVNENATGIQGGSGLMGIWGAQNIAAGLSPIGTPLQPGQQQQQGYAAQPSALGPVGLGGGAPGYAGDAALLANVPSGRYTQTQGADLTQGLADCSSAVEDLVNIMDGRPTGGRSMATGNAAEWLPAHGFLPGSAPGAFNVGFNSGHMQATLPGGTPFNWGSDASAANRGIGGTGAFDPAFTSHYYRPVSAGPGGGAQGQPGTLGAPSFTGGGGGAGIGGAQSSMLSSQQQTGGTGKGFDGLGGMPMEALMGAAGGLDLLAPGAGQAAQVGIKLANRAIGFAGQAAGIGVGGLLEMFLPHNSELGDPGKSWVGKIAGGFAGAKPSIPNQAGKSAPPLTPEQAAAAGQTQHGSQGGAAPGPMVNIEHQEVHDSDTKQVNSDIARNQASQMAWGPR